MIALEVSSTADTNATACSKVTKTAEEVQAILETFSPAESSAKSNGNVALTHWSMASLQTTSYVSRPRNRNSQLPNRKLIFEASVTFNIRVRNFDKLGMLATELCQMRLVKIKKISWMLTDNTVATSQVELRKMAVADALQKAKEYAAALDLYKVTPSELVEQQDSICPVNATVTAYNGGGTGTRSSVLLQAKVDGKQDVCNNSKSLFLEPEEVFMSVTIGCTFAAK